MNRLVESLAQDPAIGSFLPELAAIVNTRTDDIFYHNKKGIGLAHALDSLPDVQPSSTDTNHACIRIGKASNLNPDQEAALYKTLARLKPWRKGPFEFFGIRIESEWNSALKWNRLAGHLGPLSGKRVLDIGSNCGYYMFRLAVRQPALILGIEPYLNYYFQYRTLSRYLAFPQVHCLPLKLEELPPLKGCFDTVLCMGILYHRRSPLDTLVQIHGMMVPGGQLVLETLVLEGDGELALFPEKRYAKMNNVFFIPTVDCLTHWLMRSGFESVRCVDVSRTTSKEQRKTDWIDTQSLADFLDPEDPGKTVEGYPAPVRAMLLATAGHR
jgi:tRNA (mo5U34)-methyltransferase